MLEIFKRGHSIAVGINPGFMPAGTNRNKEGLSVGSFVLEQFFDEIGLIFQMREILFAKPFTLAIKLIRQTLKEKHTKNKFFKLRSIHLPA